MINKSFEPELQKINPEWKSNSRIFGEVIELWVSNNLKCKCGGAYDLYKANKKSVDAVCIECEKTLQIKSMSKPYKPNKSNVLRILAAEYTTTLNSIRNKQDWDLMLVHYSKDMLTIEEVHIIESKEIDEDCVIPRKPLGPNARRAGWQGCYLDFNWDKVEKITI